jgi:hypothetical protein
MIPVINTFMERHAEELNKHSDVTDERVANELAKIMVDDIGKELDSFMNDKVKWRIGKLRAELDRISRKPYNELTKKEAAERRLIVNWVYLMEREEDLPGIAGALLQSFGDTYKSFFSDL